MCNRQAKWKGEHMLLFPVVMAASIIVTYHVIKVIRKRKKRAHFRMMHQCRLEAGPLTDEDFRNMIEDIPWSMSRETVTQKDRAH